MIFAKVFNKVRFRVFMDKHLYNTHAFYIGIGAILVPIVLLVGYLTYIETQSLFWSFGIASVFLVPGLGIMYLIKKSMK